MIKALTFDLDDTLYDNRPVIANMEATMMAWLNQLDPNHRITTEQWLALKKASLKQNALYRHDVTQWRLATLRALFQQWQWCDSEIEHRVGEGMRLVMKARQQVTIPAETHRVLSILSARYPLVAITNGNVDVEQIGLASYFSAVYLAGKDGLAKPNGDLFEKAQRFLNVSPSAILHVGDHPISDIQGAHQAGFQSCWLNLTDKPWENPDFSPSYVITDLSDLLFLPLP